MTAPLNFTSSIDFPDGRKIYISLEVPENHPAGLPWQYVGENSEIVHMAAIQVMRLTLQGDRQRAERAVEENAEIDAEVVF